MQLRKLHASAVQRRDMLQDVAHALKQQFPAARIGEQNSTFHPVGADAFAVAGQREHRGQWDPDTTSVHSYGSSGVARPNANASVLREVINNAAAAGSVLLPTRFIKINCPEQTSAESIHP